MMQIKTYPLEYVGYLIFNEIEATQIREMSTVKLKEVNQELAGNKRVREAIRETETLNQEMIERL